MKIAARCLAASALAHFLFLAPIKGCAGGSGEGGEGDQKGDGDQIKITVISKSDKSDQGQDECQSAFAGIGISYDLFKGGAITAVYAGYPAHHAGIKIGDKIVGDPYEIRGEPGTPVRVRVERDGTELVFDLIRERICTDHEP